MAAPVEQPGSPLHDYGAARVGRRRVVHHRVRTYLMPEAAALVHAVEAHRILGELQHEYGMLREVCGGLPRTA